MTKHIHDPLSAAVDDLKVEVCPKLIDNTAVITTPHVLPETTEKIEKRMVKAKVTTKKCEIERLTNNLYNLENNTGPDKVLNIDLDLYQMEDY